MDVSQIIAALGGPAKVATHLGIPANTVAYWRRRQSLPAKHWLSLTEMDAAGAAGVTMDRLARTAATTTEQSAAPGGAHRDGGACAPNASPAIAFNSEAAQ